jgi:protein MpaA
MIARLGTGRSACDAGTHAPYRGLAPACFMLAAAFTFSAGCERVDHAAPVTLRRAEPVARAPAVTPAVQQPRIRTIELGRSVNGTPLTLEVFGDGEDRVLIFGGIHGSEPTSAALARKLADHLRINWDLFEGKTVAILPAANPDGLARRSRTNARGVDLNRNFPAKNWRRSRHGHRRGASAPASEPETRAVIRAVELIRPDRIIAIHATGRGGHCNNYDGPAEDLAALMAQSNGYPVKATMGYPTPGSFGSWAGIDREIPTVTLELPQDLSGQRCWRENAEALRAFLNATAK